MTKLSCITFLMSFVFFVTEAMNKVTVQFDDGQSGTYDSAELSKVFTFFPANAEGQEAKVPGNKSDFDFLKSCASENTIVQTNVAQKWLPVLRLASYMGIKEDAQNSEDEDQKIITQLAHKAYDNGEFVQEEDSLSSSEYGNLKTYLKRPKNVIVEKEEFFDGITLTIGNENIRGFQDSYLLSDKDKKSAIKLNVPQSQLRSPHISDIQLQFPNVKKITIGTNEALSHIKELRIKDLNTLNSFQEITIFGVESIQQGCINVNEGVSVYLPKNTIPELQKKKVEAEFTSANNKRKKNGNWKRVITNIGYRSVPFLVAGTGLATGLFIARKTGCNMSNVSVAPEVVGLFCGAIAGYEIFKKQDPRYGLYVDATISFDDKLHKKKLLMGNDTV